MDGTFVKWRAKIHLISHYLHYGSEGSLKELDFMKLQRNGYFFVYKIIRHVYFTLLHPSASNQFWWEEVNLCHYWNRSQNECPSGYIRPLLLEKENGTSLGKTVPSDDCAVWENILPIVYSCQNFKIYSLSTKSLISDAKVTRTLCKFYSCHSNWKEGFDEALLLGFRNIAEGPGEFQPWMEHFTLPARKMSPMELL